MSLEGKNRYLFSYSNKQIEGKRFQYKDFEKQNHIIAHLGILILLAHHFGQHNSNIAHS